MPRSKMSSFVAIPLFSLFVITALIIGSSNAAISVKPGYSIQLAIDYARPGQIIEVQNGTYNETINITKSLILQGQGNPVIDARGKGSAITISANGTTLRGFTATGSGEGAGDAGIRVRSRQNIINNNSAVKNNNIGIFLFHASNNTLSGNSAVENNNSGIMLVHSNDNQISSNYIGRNKDGVLIQTSRGNTLTDNNLNKNRMGINISNYNYSESITANAKSGKGVSIKYKPSSEATSRNVSALGFDSMLEANLLFRNSLLDNAQDAFDDGFNQWDNGESGNYYSSYDAREEGCKDRNRDGICDSGYGIPGGHNTDRLPKASADAILQYKSKGLMGTVMKMDQRTYLPGDEIELKYSAPGNFSGWFGVVKVDLPRGLTDRALAYSSQDIKGESGKANLKAPVANGSYDLRMYNSSSGEEMATLNFHVAVPTISASPPSVNSCEDIAVTYTGAPGYESDWIAMYKSGSPDSSYIAKLYLDGNENGTLTLEAPDPGSYDFRLFENDSSAKLATSNSVEAKAMKGNKVIATPSQVGPGGTVTVKYWGAPPEGTGVIGMYGMNRPDKFYLQMVPIGSKNCGSLTFQLPNSAGQYDFRMFRSAITDVGQGAYQILGQSNAVTVS